jgi:pimeloyl-ACP methyl ester carboxylesterase
MQFHAFGNKENKTVLALHGMICDWQKFRELLKPLEEEYYVIYPAMSGCYDGSPDFVSFEKECEHIEEYVNKNHDGKLFSVWGASQGATVLTELLSRNRLSIEKAILDGVYLAHQGKLCAKLGLKAFLKMQKNGGQVSKRMQAVSRLMGLGKEDMAEFSLMYWKSSKESMRANLLENYTYHVNGDISQSKTKVYLWCGNREPYAIKSHEILKKYLKNYEEKIWPDAGHGVMLYFHTDEYIEEIRKILEKDE